MREERGLAGAALGHFRGCIKSDPCSSCPSSHNTRVCSQWYNVNIEMVGEEDMLCIAEWLRPGPNSKLVTKIKFERRIGGRGSCPGLGSV